MLAAPVVAALAPALPRPTLPASAPAVALPPLRPLPRSLMERCAGFRTGAGARSIATRPTARPSQAVFAPARQATPVTAATATAPAAWSHRRLGWPAALLALLLLLAALLAPEAPQDQAAICQRHNGAVACRVW